MPTYAYTAAETKAYARSLPTKGTMRLVTDYLCECIQWGGPGAGTTKLCISTIAEVTKTGVRNVQKIIRRLETMGVLRIAEEFRDDGWQLCNRYIFPGFRAFVARLRQGGKTSEKSEKTVHPRNEQEFTPSSSSSDFHKIPPTPNAAQTEPAASGADGLKEKRVRKGKRTETTDAQEADLLAQGRRLVDAFNAAGAAWGKVTDWADSKLRVLAQRANELGGEAAYLQRMARGKTANWIATKIDFTPFFFASARNAAKIDAGQWGVKLEKKPAVACEPDLVNEPWLAYLPDLARHIQGVPYGRLQDLVHEAQNKGHSGKRIFGAHARAYAVWRYKAENAAETMGEAVPAEPQMGGEEGMGDAAQPVAEPTPEPIPHAGEADPSNGHPKVQQTPETDLPTQTIPEDAKSSLTARQQEILRLKPWETMPDYAKLRAKIFVPALSRGVARGKALGVTSGLQHFAVWLTFDPEGQTFIEEAPDDGKDQ